MLHWFKTRWLGVRSLSLLAALGLILAGFSVGILPALAKGPAGVDAGAGVRAPASAGQTIALADLPKQGRDTYALILAGGPFPYDKDGTVFGNRERILPTEKRGFYREYTVKTPAASTRGAKRIVCGGSPAHKPRVCYYTDDHYASFKQIAP